MLKKVSSKSMCKKVGSKKDVQKYAQGSVRKKSKRKKVSSKRYAQKGKLKKLSSKKYAQERYVKNMRKTVCAIKVREKR